MLPHGVLHSAPGGPPQHFEDCFGRFSENLNAGGGVQRLFICPSCALADHSHMKFKRVRIGMDLNDCHLSSFVIRVLVKSDKTWFICFDEADQPRHPPSLGLELSRRSRFVAMKMNGPAIRLPPPSDVIASSTD